MLKIRCFADFKYGTQIVILGEQEDYAQAGKYLANKDSASLDNPNFAIYYETRFVTRQQLYLNKKECVELAEIFIDFESHRGCHDYYQSEVLEDTDIDILISIGEYSYAIFEEEDE